MLYKLIVFDWFAEFAGDSEIKR